MTTVACSVPVSNKRTCRPATLIIGVWLVATCAARGESRGSVPAVIPLPDRISPAQPGMIAVHPRTLGVSEPGLRPTAEACIDALSRVGADFELVDGKADIVLSPTSDKELGDEGYRLKIDASRIDIEAAAPAGAFYACQTLAQILAHAPRDESHAWEIPAVEIQDAPRFHWRGMHLDVCRHFMPVDFVKRYIDLLALYKFNVFHWHLTEDQGWRLAIEDYPKLTGIAAWRNEEGRKYGGFYSRDEVRDVVAYAAARHITVVPEIEMPGHALAALSAYPDLSCTGGPFEVATTWGVFDDVFCAGNDDVFAFLTTVLDHVVTLFPGPYVHIGGDECPKERWEHCPKCQERMKREGLTSEEELQAYFVKRIAGHLAKKNRTLVGWDEITEGGLARNAIVMSWRGVGPGVLAARSGNQVVMAPVSHAYFDYRQRDHDLEPGAAWAPALPLERVYSFDPADGLNKETASRILGVQANVWTETMSTPKRVEYMAVPRMCAMAEVAWTPTGRRSWPGFRQRLESHRKLLDRLDVNYCDWTSDEPGKAAGGHVEKVENKPS